MKNKQNIDDFNNYGILVTVASLLMLVVYDNGKYDSWDLMTVFLTGYFGYSYLKKGIYFDFFSCFTATFIVISSIVLSFVAIIELNDLIKNFQILVNKKTLGINNLLLMICSISIIVSIFIKNKSLN